MAATHFDVAVVGAGMVGLAQACALADSELSVALIDAAQETESETEGWDPRVVSLTQSSEEFLQSLGAWSIIRQQRCCPYRRMLVWDAEGTGSVEFTAEDLNRDSLGHIVENRIVTRALRQGLSGSRIKRISASVNAVEFVGDASTKRGILRGDGLEISASLLIAADGASSRLRELAGLRTREWEYGHKAIVATVELEKSHEFCAWQRFAVDGPLAFLPLSEDGASNLCSIVWSLNTERAESLLACDDNVFAAALAAAIEHRFGALKILGRRLALPLKQRHARNYYHENLVLIGDAAHTIHPLAGQGVNLGFYDVAALSAEIDRARARNVPLCDASLARRYQRARQTHNLMAMASMEGFKRLFGSDDLRLRWLRNSGMNFVNRQSLLKKKLAALAAGKVAFG